MDKQTYLDKCHGSWVGKVTGSNFGMPFEGKSPQWMEKTYGQVVGWQQIHADEGSVINDDEQFELVAILACEDHGYENLSVDLLADYWKKHLNPNYLFTAEKTVYENWEQGISPSEAASPEHNPWWDFIGGQMKGELFGQLCPENFTIVQKLAQIDGQVAHRGIGVDGEIFIAMMVAQGMSSTEMPTTSLLEEHIIRAMAYCTQDDLYVELILQVLDWFHAKPEAHKWRETFKKIEFWWREEVLPELIETEEKTPTHPERQEILMQCAVFPWQICHVLPNAGIIATALLYSEGDFGIALQLAAMMGYDVDCNTGNIGGILGAYYGAQSMARYWTKFSKDEIKVAINNWKNGSLTDLAYRIEKLADY